MKRTVLAAALIAAVVTSTAAIAAPKANTSETGYQPGQFFNCLIPFGGPTGFREGPCWIHQG
jgi:hypothetical protein